MGRFPLQPTPVIAHDGAVEYVVCNEHLEPLYTPARTLAELRERFLRGGAA